MWPLAIWMITGSADVEAADGGLRLADIGCSLDAAPRRESSDGSGSPRPAQLLTPRSASGDGAPRPPVDHSPGWRARWPFQRRTSALPARSATEGASLHHSDPCPPVAAFPSRAALAGSGGTSQTVHRRWSTAM